MRGRARYLFHDDSLELVISHRERDLVAEINDFSSDYILNVSVDNLCDHLEAKYRFFAPVLRADETYISNTGEADVDVSQDPFRGITDRSRPFYIKGTFATFAVPFDGDGNLFGCSPSTFTTVIPYGDIAIVDNELHITVTVVDHDPQNMQANFNGTIREIQQYANWVAQDVGHFNANLKQRIKERIEQRRNKLLKDQSLTAALGFPMKRRDDASKTYAVPVIRRKLPVQPPKTTTEPIISEPTLEIKEYEHILNVILNMVQVMERSPRAFAGMEEEDLRNHFLVQLNGQYEGQATGETFNYEGKTDILIRTNGRNIFIAECKFWKGSEGLLKTIDQLLGYASWHDTKTAIILFNRNKNLSTVLTKIPEVVRSHTNFKRQLNYTSETGFRFVIHQRDDKNREITLTVLVFDVPL